MNEEEIPEETNVQELELEQLRRDAQEYKEKYFLTLAESENTRKRLQRERQEGNKHAIADVMCEFLKPLDHFETALKHAESSSEEVKNWAIGFEMILTQFKDVLAAHNIVSFDSKGEHFDPHLHEAVEMVETEVPEGTVLEEVLRGYKMGERILRPAQVKVAKSLEEQPGETNDEEEVE